MKHLVLIIGTLAVYLINHLNILPNGTGLNYAPEKSTSTVDYISDTCVIEGHTFKMIDYKSTKKLRAYIKNSQIYVESKGLQYSKFRITYYVFSSIDDESMPIVRHFDQRLSPSVLKILKNAGVGTQYLIEEIIVIDPSNKELTNAVRPILLERIKN